MKKWIAALLRRLAELIAGPLGEPTVTIGDARPTTPTDAAWDKALSDYVVSIGTKARATAGAWATSASGLLGVIAAASVLKGRETLDSLADPWRAVLAALVLIALVSAFVTLYSAALAAQGSPSSQLLAPDTYRQAQFRAADSASFWMTWSRRTVIAAFLAAALATVLVLVGPEAPNTSRTLVVGGKDGAEIACGKLEVKGNVLTINETAVPSPALSFHTVKECP